MPVSLITSKITCPQYRAITAVNAVIYDLKIHNIRFDVSIKDYYNLLVKNKSISFAVPDFDDFYVDLSHKIRKNTAMLCGVYVSGILISCACAVAIDEYAAVIGGVATLPEYKQQGFGSTAVASITEYLHKKNKRIFLHRNLNKLEDFYTKLGYVNCSEWQELFHK
ncbi:hypothetical protein AGMMS50284_6210 [Clostridia bacterium]|nr:hypothetical protein AGMMS50284_6210 [Clostridia bacterium]